MEKQEEEDYQETSGALTIKNTISHFCHSHDLVDRHLNDEDFLCAACADPISGQAYACTAGCRFHIHSSCLSHMPHQVEHLFHWTHHLLPEHLPDDQTAQCDACLGQITGVAFRCEHSFCNFNLHASCTNHPTRGLDHSCHYHHLYYYPDKRVTRKDCFCKLCGEACDNGGFYRCVWADVNFHLHCIPLQASLKHEHHGHQLTLMASLVGETSLSCHACGAGCDVNHSAYFCQQCSKFAAHIECVASEEKIEHFSHEHGLSFIKDGTLFQVEKRCECCLLVVQGTAAYACLTCNFWLHQNCFQLPLNMEHHDHLHPNHSLRLVTGSDYKMSETFLCDLCTDLYAGFRYYCQDCGFTLDLACAASEKLEKDRHGERSRIHHFTHEHPLTLSSCEKLKDRVAGQEMLQKFRCKRCLQVISGHVFCCCNCEFFLHESCTELPDKMDHPLHPHHMLLARDSEDERCNACDVCFSGITYKCERCHFNLEFNVLFWHLVDEGFEISSHSRSGKYVVNFFTITDMNTLHHTTDSNIVEIKLSVQFSFWQLNLVPMA